MHKHNGETMEKFNLILRSVHLRRVFIIKIKHDSANREIQSRNKFTASNLKNE